MSRSSILVIDDHPDNFDVIQSLLHSSSYDLHYSASGKDAIAQLDTFNPDLILLDVMMPDMDGIEVCRYIKGLDRWKTVPIVMLTALDALVVVSKCSDAGADDFMTKPIKGVELRSRLRAMLRFKYQHDHIQQLYQRQQKVIASLESTIGELRGNLASSLSHELNTPLNGLIGTLSLLQEDLDTLDRTEIREMLSWADLSAHRLEKLTNKLLTYLELELIERAAAPRKTATTKLLTPNIQGAIKAMVSSAQRQDDFSLAVPAEVAIALPERYLLTIFQELLDNALKFSPPGTPISITGQIHILDQQVKIRVLDQGRGMTPEQIKKVGAFMQFERKSYEQQGVGMGLKLVKTIMGIAQGNFEIQSTYGQATAIILTFPLTPSAAP